MMLCAIYLLLFLDRVDSVNMAEILDSPSERLNPPALLVPGAPPILNFRYFEAQDRGRYSGLALVIDDAGH